MHYAVGHFKHWDQKSNVETVTLLVPLGIHPLEILAVASDELIQGRVAWATRAVESLLHRKADHDRGFDRLSSQSQRAGRTFRAGCLSSENTFYTEGG